MQITEERFHELYEQLMKKELDGKGINEMLSGIWSGYRLDLVYKLMSMDDEYYRSKASWFIYELGSLRGMFYYMDYPRWLKDSCEDVRWHVVITAISCARVRHDLELLTQCCGLLGDEDKSVRGITAKKIQWMGERDFCELIESHEFCMHAEWAPDVKRIYRNNDRAPYWLANLLYHGDIAAYMFGAILVGRCGWLEGLMEIMPAEDWERLRGHLITSAEGKSPQLWYRYLEHQSKSLKRDQEGWVRQMKSAKKKSKQD